MSDPKSKLPDLNELGGMVGKFFKDVCASITEIKKEYVKKREATPSVEPTSTPKPPPAETKPAKATKPRVVVKEDAAPVKKPKQKKDE